MVAMQTILPEGSLQEGIVSYPGHQPPPAIRAARNSFLRQANTCQATSQLLHKFAVFPNIIPAGLAALAVAKVSLKGANLFLGKYPKKLLIDISGQHKDSKILFLELGVGRMTPMFIQEPFWNLTLSFPHARHIGVNDKYDFLPKQLEDKGMTIVADIAQVLRDARDTMGSGDNDQ